MLARCDARRMVRRVGGLFKQVARSLLDDYVPSIRDRAGLLHDVFAGPLLLIVVADSFAFLNSVILWFDLHHGLSRSRLSAGKGSAVSSLKYRTGLRFRTETAEPKTSASRHVVDSI